MSRTSVATRGATLIRAVARTLRGTSIPPATDVCPHVAYFPAPSVAHLPACVLPGSQRPGLSASARRVLLPLQQFSGVYNVSRDLSSGNSRLSARDTFPLSVSLRDISPRCGATLTGQGSNKKSPPCQRGSFITSRYLDRAWIQSRRPEGRSRSCRAYRGRSFGTSHFRRKAG